MDVIVLGGGIVGLTMANLLAQNTQVHIYLISNTLPELAWQDTTYDLRCSAITRAAQQVFRNLGIWDSIVDCRVGKYEQMHVWDDQSQAQINFVAREFGEPDLGHIIENRVMLRALYNKLCTASNVEIILGEPNSMHTATQHNSLQIGDRQIAAQLLIGADGAASWLRRQASIPVHGWDYQQTAIVATIKTELPHRNTAWQRFAVDGPLAFLPLDQSNLCSIVWSTNPEKANTLMNLDDDTFCQQLAAEFSYKLGALQLQGMRASYPLRMLHAAKYIAPRIAIIGDAAHVIHPLAGQGLNLGILDAAVLAVGIQNAIQQGRDIGGVNCLRKFERSRRGHNVGMIAIVEFFKRLFGTQQSVLIAARAHGLRLVNNFNFIKRPMLAYALGLHRNLPE